MGSVRWLAATALIGLLAGTIGARKREFVVSADGTGDFKSVQAAVDALPEQGGTIRIRPGIYREPIVVVKEIEPSLGPVAVRKIGPMVPVNIAGREAIR